MNLLGNESRDLPTGRSLWTGVFSYENVILRPNTDVKLRISQFVKFKKSAAG